MSITTSKTTQNVTAGQVAGGGGLAGILLAVRSAYPDLIPWGIELDAVIVATLSTYVVPKLSRWFAFRRDPIKKELAAAKEEASTLRCLPFLLAASLAFSGCATMLPAVGGNTHYQVDFSDVTEDQATSYSMKVKAPAGTELAGITGMTYDWKPDGSGGISVSNQGGLDTQGQADMITEVSRQQVEAFRAGMGAALDALAPFVGQALDARVKEGEIKAGIANNAIDAARGR